MMGSKQGVSCVVQLQSSQLQVTDAALYNSPSPTETPSAQARSSQYKCTHLKFMVYGRKQAYTHASVQGARSGSP